MVERASMPENPELEITDLIIDTAPAPNDYLQPSNLASTTLFKEIINSISGTHHQLRVLLQRSLRVLLICGKRVEVSAGDSIRTDIECTTAIKSKPPVYEAQVGGEADGLEQPPVAGMCIDKGSDSREDPISLAGVDMGINHVRDTGYDLCSQGKQRPRSIHMSEAIAFMNLDDPFACYTVGSPRVVKNLDSVLPSTYRSTNKVVEARRRFRWTMQRPQSAGRRPGSAGRRSGSANDGKIRRQVESRVGAFDQITASRGVRPYPRTLKKLPTLRSTQLRPSSPCGCSVPTPCKNLSEESQLRGFTYPSSALSIAQQRTHSTRSFEPASHRSSAQTVAFSPQPKRASVAFSSQPTPLRPATPKRRLAHTSLSPSAARQLKDYRKSFVTK